MKKQSYIRRKFVEAGRRIPRSRDLMGKRKFTTKGAGRRLAREIVDFGGYKRPAQLRNKPVVKQIKKKKKRRVKKVVYYK